MTTVRFDPSQADSLDLDSLGRGLPGITPHVGAFYAEAATTSLEEQQHNPGVSMQIDGDFNHRVRILWSEKEDRLQRDRAWEDRDVATENGAYAIALLLVEELTDYTVIKRAAKGTSFDFWLSKKDSCFFEDSAKLEVSGLRQGSTGTVATRVRQKLRQIEPSDHRLPGVVTVVEFGTPRAHVRTK